MKAQKVFEFLGSRNLNTTPIDITGLQGDTYDYILITFFDVSGTNTNVVMHFNNDTSANYRIYQMTGNGGAASAVVADSETSIDVGARYAFGKPAFGISKITGSIGGERLISSLSGQSVTTSGSTRVLKCSNYWKDTVNELASIQISSASVITNYHFILYQVPKAKSQSNWEQIGDPLVWTAESTEKSFTGLDGNQDEQYRLVWSGDQLILTEINNDGGSNYNYQFLRNNNGNIEASANTNTAIHTDERNSELIINAKTGTKRLVSISGSSAGVNIYQTEYAWWYTDTVTNITTLDCTPTASTSGTATLYRKIKKDAAPSALPWRLAADPVQISGDFSAGVTFSNLEGDKSTLFMVEFIGANTSGNIELRSQINSDTSNINVEQLLKADTSTVSAAAATRTYIVNCKLQNGDQAYSKTIMYPRTGSDRPILTECSYDENALEKLAQWYGESVTEMTSLKVFASTSNSITGTLKIWRLS